MAAADLGPRRPLCTALATTTSSSSSEVDDDDGDATTRCLLLDTKIAPLDLGSMTGVGAMGSSLLAGEEDGDGTSVDS